MPRQTERREPIRVRVLASERLELQHRADEEVPELPPGRNLSEMARRVLTFGQLYMPPGWTPEGDPLTGVCDHCRAVLEWDGVWRDAEDLNPGCPVNVAGHVPSEDS